MKKLSDRDFLPSPPPLHNELLYKRPSTTRASQASDRVINYKQRPTPPTNRQ
jgi:hypothetical protein